MLSLHTSPLVQPGGGDAGGMNVYVRELVAALAHGGTDTTVYVRRWSNDLPTRLTVEPGFEVVHVDFGFAFACLFFFRSTSRCLFFHRPAQICCYTTTSLQLCDFFSTTRRPEPNRSITITYSA